MRERGAPFAFVAGYDSAGNLKWRRVWAGGGNGVAVAGDGTIIATGVASYASQDGLSGLAGCWMPIPSPYVVKLGADGAFRWAEAIAPDAYWIGVTATPAGAAVIAGRIGAPNPTSSFLIQLAP